MPSPIIKRFHQPEEVRRPPHSLLETVSLGRATASRLTLQPGWRWSQDIKPYVGTELCEIEHTLIVLRGQMRARMESGEETDIRPGDVVVLPPRHDAWVVGDEDFVAIDFSDLAHRISIPAEPAYDEMQLQPTVH